MGGERDIGHRIDTAWEPGGEIGRSWVRDDSRNYPGCVFRTFGMELQTSEGRAPFAIPIADLANFVVKFFIQTVDGGSTRYRGCD